MDVGGWLRSLGLGQYEALFRASDIDSDILPELTEVDLEKLGVSLGHRKRLLRAISGLAAAETLVAPSASTGAKPHDAAERRQLTVMFCDLVGSTPLSARLDPEDLRGIIGAYHRCVAEIVESFGGFVARYMGDGALVYFGYPQAHEDDAERATRCGLALVDRVPRLGQVEELHARIGIATGLVVVGGEVVEHDVAGETPNLAARLQALAEPDTVVIAPSTRRLTGDLFEYRDLGEIELKGIAGPVSAWRALRPSAVASRFEALRGSALTPLVGRDEEIDLLLRRWVRAKAGNGQVVLVSGEPGIGKSRVTAELEERLRGEPHLRLRHFCSPYHQNSALFPFIEQLARAAGFARDDPPAAKLDKLWGLLSRVAPPDEDLALLADLLSLPSSDRHPLPNLSPQRKKERILEALLRQLEGLARQQPVLMVFEDAHWIDPTSRELLDLTVERGRGMPMLLIVTFRPEFQPSWTGQPQVSVLTLNRLDLHNRTDLVAKVAGGKPLPNEVVNQIADRTDGVPLFVEELTKSVLESGLLREEAERYVLARPLPPFAIPTSLNDSLMARLDRLASVRRVAQIGAAIGREFPYALLRIVSRLPEDELRSALAGLIASELVFQRGVPPDAVYAFKHALVQDAAHGALLRSSRQQLHAQIAEALEAHFPDTLENQPELLAQHFAEAGLIEKCVTYWAKAGHRSADRSVMVEAAAQFQKGLDQLALLPDNFKHQRLELEFRGALGGVLNAIKGNAASETGQAYARARELWEKLGAPSEFLNVPYGQSRYHMFRGEFDLAQKLAEELLHLSKQRGDSGGLILGHFSSGRNLMLAGRFALSRSHLAEVLTLYDPVSHGSLIQQIASHPHTNSQTFLGLVLFCLGYPDQGLQQSNAAIDEAQRLAHPQSLAVSLTYGNILLSLVGDNTAFDEQAQQLLALTTEQGFRHWHAEATVYRGWLNVKNGNVTEGISLLRSGSTGYRSTGAEAWTPNHIALLARAYEIAGKMEKAVAQLDEALQIVERTGVRWFTAELNRHKGQLLLRQGHSAAAEELYRKALEIAEEQKAKTWELRAAVSLARLCRDQGRRAKARDLLAPVYGWFTEGFDTTDLKDAKALLDELGT
jgi:predicted ATPase/class 3 adenylate cyclase